MSKRSKVIIEKKTAPATHTPAHTAAPAHTPEVTNHEPHKKEAVKLISPFDSIIKNSLAHLRSRRNGPFIGSGNFDTLKNSVKDEIIKVVESDPILTSMEGQELHDYINKEFDKIK